VSVERPDKLPLNDLCAKDREIMQNAILKNLSCDITGIRKRSDIKNKEILDYVNGKLEGLVTRKEVIAGGLILVLLMQLKKIFIP
jgi:hypothetical protein